MRLKKLFQSNQALLLTISILGFSYSNNYSVATHCCLALINRLVLVANLDQHPEDPNNTRPNEFSLNAARFSTLIAYANIVGSRSKSFVELASPNFIIVTLAIHLFATSVNTIKNLSSLRSLLFKKLDELKAEITRSDGLLDPLNNTRFLRE